MYDRSFYIIIQMSCIVRSVLHHSSDIMHYRKNFSCKRDSQIIIF